ncbi:hypothetical protein EV191_107134 [Tamaricihabitans halophyticus]|uniref:Lumazine-binding protein n=1 Tax=Tamaricihabitans halophyticus TaxID=1262583 RepID=A0A4R2QMS6_9PSEU|nr:hypothetical protein [Tamaricihabitans halophyticus]TCP50870.1 hypothetical protein EV191_107134 [Tamaricihabitans halophyticus]
MLVAAGIAVTLILVLGGGGAQATAEKVVAAINDKDAKAAAELECGDNSDGSMLAVPPELENAQIDASLESDAEENGDTATATISVKVSMQGQELELKGPMTFKNEGGDWCASNFEPEQPNM